MLTLLLLLPPGGGSLGAGGGMASLSASAAILQTASCHTVRVNAISASQNVGWKDGYVR